MTAPQITKVLNPPLISDSVEDFNVKAFQTVNDLNPMMAEVNTVATYINTKSGEVAANVATAAGAAAAANTATTKAAEAAASALAADASKTAAAGSATSASGSASTATTQATAASNSATAAAGSATTASTAKTAAETAATNAGNSATAAATSATTAGTAATAASNSATAAAGSATSANTAKTAAETARDDAQTARTQAQTAATAADASATNAANSAAAAAQSTADAEAIATGDLLANTAPEALGTSAVGTSSRAARSDHVHLMPTAAQVGATPAAHAGAGGAAHAVATGGTAGFMAAADKTKLDALPANAALTSTLAAKADLVGGKVPEGQLPAIAITDIFSVASQSAMLALAAERGDIAVRSDINKSFALSAEPASTLANWIELRTPTDAVLSVAGKTGAVTLSKSDVGLSNVDNTADANKPVATTSVNGLMSAADKTKLNGIASNATANASNAELRDRSTHTGTQEQSTVTNLTTDLAARVNRQDNYATVTSGVINLALETELYHMTVSGNVTVSVSNAPTTSRVVKRLIVQYSSGVLTWPASFKLPTPMPTFAAGKAYVFSIEQSPNSGVYFLVPGPEYTYP